ncbi:hypothetical protein [Azospirillum sp.]|uniref:hypothetical protein n=1 Tax=Azospirillum sp. TaxID=34012 RepID=UPI002634CE72|nr:hypothetical protein [Azospirillum sp.]
MSRTVKSFLAAAILFTPLSAMAFDVDGYKAVVTESVRELLTGTISDPAASLARQEKLIALGVEACKENAKDVPADAKIMELVIASAEGMKGLTPDQLEAKWGDAGDAGDAIGVPLKSLDQFSKTRNYIDLVVHPARAYSFIKAWQSSKNKQALVEAKGELTEVLEHSEKLRKAK